VAWAGEKSKNENLEAREILSLSGNLTSLGIIALISHE
jgi:hypothetical protein